MRQAPKFSAGVRATAQGYLALFADEIVCRNVAVSDFMASDLACAEHPVTVYLQPPPSDVPRLRPLTRLILNQICRALQERLETDNRGRAKMRRVLFELDEFALFGRLDFFVASLRQMAGYGLVGHLIVQSLNDLAEKYGPYQTILDNCHVITVFASADVVTAERVSKMTGVAVEYRESFGHKRWLRLIPDTVQQSEQLRPLMQPGDVRMLPSHEQLVFVNGHPPMRTTKVRYYVDREFKKLILPPPKTSDGVDAPRELVSRELGVRHDWLGERAKGSRVVSDEIFEAQSDDEWMPPEAAPGPMQGLPPSGPVFDAYSL
jgi:type IV secretion system protein VirD4